MANYHIRVCAVGSKDEIGDLLRCMLRSCGELNEDPDGLEPPLSQTELLRRISELTDHDSGNREGFLYEMVAPEPFGSADGGSSLFNVREEPCGEWSACFDYHSRDAFQPDDWLRLHERCGRLQLAAQYACDDFSREKGCSLISGGQVLDDWSRMAEVWFWLAWQYTGGEGPEGAVEQLTKIGRALRQEDFDLGPDELIASCEEILRRLVEQTAVPAQLRAQLDAARQRGDWGEIGSVRTIVAESVLWEADHSPKWLACLEAAREAWDGRY